jgi:hypothetical protein
MRRISSLRTRRPDPELGPEPVPDKPKRPQNAFWDMVEAEVGALPTASVLVVGNDLLRVPRRVLPRLWPELRVCELRADEDASRAHVRLVLEGPFDFVIDMSDMDAPDQARLFQRTFMHLRPGGSYLVRQLRHHEAAPSPGPDDAAATAVTVPAVVLPNENVPEERPYEGDLWSLVSQAQDARLRGFDDHRGVGVPYRDVAGLGKALAAVEVRGRMLRVVNGTRVSAKIREEEMGAVLRARPDLGEELDQEPPLTWRPDVDYQSNWTTDRFIPDEFHCTASTLRRYDEPTCSRGQVVTRDGLLFPETFRHHWMKRMVNIYVVEKAPLFGSVRRNLSSPQPLEGAYFHLDSEWPGHYGHLLTEQVSRLWAWDRVRALEPDVKVLMTLQHDREPAVLLPFEEQVLGAFGIEPDDVHIFSTTCSPERLYTATPTFSLPAYVRPETVAVWDRIARHVLRGQEEKTWPARIFVSRRPSFKRACHNTAEVEDYFRSHGFEVVFPEDHPLADQIAMFRAADAIGGFAGSALFTMALVDQPKRVVSLAPDTYTARNEYLIAAVRGHRLASVWSRGDVPHPTGSWTQKAFSSSFTFDFGDEGRFLDQWMAGLDA